MTAAVPAPIPVALGIRPEIAVAAIPDDERVWVPQADGVWFRPLLLNTVSGGWCNLLRVRRAGVLSPEMRLLVTTGFLGGLTTFSTFSAEVTTLLVRREWLWSALTVGLHVVGSVAFTVLGILLARMLFTWGSS
jgi:hypothetical protein